MDSSQFAWLRHQQFQEGSEQTFAPNTDVMHELKEAQIERLLHMIDCLYNNQNLTPGISRAALRRRLHASNSRRVDL